MNAPLPSHAAAPEGAAPAAATGLAAPAVPMLQLQLSLDDVNLLLEAVGALPFARVYGLVGRIQSQAAAQLQAHPG
ncbi:hypothetical protein AACH10_00625 [Ideonella sp. DXS22W]|uniref:Uncharacterized protein n=1 Tax=Pseudaquabacterium inlustre TaxID=2984192 RepID=A0ABU9CCU7_9BURK